MNIKYTPPPEILIEDDGVAVKDAGTINLGSNLTVTDDGYGKVTVDAVLTGSGGAIEIEDDEVSVNPLTSIINFGNGLDVTNDGSGQVTVDFDGYFGSIETRDSTVLVDPQTEVINFGNGLIVTQDLAGQVTVDFDGYFGSIETRDDGYVVELNTDTLNFGNGLTATLFDGYVTVDTNTEAFGFAYSWGDSGNKSSNSWLLNDTVPSSLAGRTVFTDVRLAGLAATSQNNETWSFEVNERVGANFNVIHTESITNARTTFRIDLNVLITAGTELAIRVSSGSARNPVVQLFFQGSG